MMRNYTKEDIRKFVTEENVNFVRLQFTDILGMIKERGNSHQPARKSTRQ